MEGPTTETLCKVCGDKASGKHYGVASCDGCRGFFKRSIRRNLEYVCKENGQCVVDVTRRNQCQACRFNKCLHVNMKKDAVQHERASRQSNLHHHQHPHRNMESHSSPIFPSALIYPPPFPYSIATISSKSEFLQSTPGGGLSTTPLNNYFVLHKYQHLSLNQGCQQLIREDEVTSSEEVRFATSQEVVKQTPNSIKNSSSGSEAIVGSPNENVYESAAKLLFLAVKWARSIPSFLQLSSHDQSLLLEDAWSELFALNAAQWSFALDQGFLVVNSAAPEYRHSALEEAVQKLRGIINRMLALRVDHTEFACLKALVLFKPELSGLNEPLHVELLQDQTHVMLHEYTSLRSKVRFGKLLLLLPALNSLEKQSLEELFFKKTIGNVPISSLLTEMLKQ